MNTVPVGRGALCECCYCCSLSAVLGNRSQTGQGQDEQMEDLEHCCLLGSTFAVGEAAPELLISCACFNMLLWQFYFSIPLLIPSIFLLLSLYSLSEGL